MKILILLLILALNSCVTYKACENKFDQGVRIDTIAIYDTIVIPHIVHVPADTARLYSNWLTLVQLGEKDTIETVNKTGDIEIKQYWKDSQHTALVTDAKYKGKTIKDTSIVPVEYHKPCPPCQQFAELASAEKKHPGITGWIMKGIRHFEFVLFGLLIILFLLSYVLHRIFK